MSVTRAPRKLAVDDVFHVDALTMIIHSKSFGHSVTQNIPKSSPLSCEALQGSMLALTAVEPVFAPGKSLLMKLI